MRGFVRAVRGVTLLSVGLSGVLLNVAMLLLVANVILRFLNRPILGLYEILTAATVVLLGLSLGDSQREKQHVALDLVTARLPARAQRWITVGTTLLAAAVFAVIAAALMRYAVLQIQVATASELLRIPSWPALAALIFGITVLIVVLLIDVVRVLVQSRLPAAEAAAPPWEERW